MANLNRGEIPFRARGRELYLQYGTREIAEVQTALGFHRPDPYQPDTLEEIAEPVLEGGKPKLDAEGMEVYRRRRVRVDAVERQRRMLAAFEACLMNPDPEATLVFFRIGLGPWQRATQTRLVDEGFYEVVRELGLNEIKLLHYKAITFGSYLKGEADEEEGEGKAGSAGPASST